MKLKSKPSERAKRRYIVFRIWSEETISYVQAKQAITDTLIEFLGERGFSQASPRLIKNLWSSRTGFLQADAKHVDAVKIGLSLIHQIGDSRVAFQTLKVSGTIKSGKSAKRQK